MESKADKETILSVIERKKRGLKRPIPIVLALVTLLVATPPVVAKTMMESYSNSARTVVCDSFSALGCIVYIKAIGISPTGASVTIKYYDGAGTHIQSENGCASGGTFLAEIVPSHFPDASPGTWTAKLYKGTPMIASDTFVVDLSAIPEFPVQASSLLVCILCGLIYVALRKVSRVW